jgi:hypothetical protein
MERWTVKLPPGVRSPFEVYVNGVLQQPGDDYQVRSGALEFSKELVKEGKLGFWRWFRGAWGIGTYRKNDVVDVRWEQDGRTHLAHDLPFTGPQNGITERG